MDILDIAGSTRTFGAPKDWNAERDGPCGGLPIRDEAYAPDVNRMVSEWRPNEIELEHLKLGAPLQLGVLGTVHPVVSLGVGAVPPPPAEGFEAKMSKIQRLMTALEDGPVGDGPDIELYMQDERTFAAARQLILALLGISAKPVGEQIAAALDARVRAKCPDEPGDLDMTVKFARRWLPECLPAEDNGQVPFARALVENVLDAAEGHLKREAETRKDEALDRAAGAARRDALKEDLPMEQSKSTDASGGGELPLAYTEEVGVAGQAYLREKRRSLDPYGAFGDGLPATFRWYELFEAMQRAALASAPPAPTPDAGSVLAKLLEAVDKLADDQCRYDDFRSGSPDLPDDTLRRIAVGDLRCLVRAREAYTSASPPPGEDLAGQGEPVAWDPTVSVGVLRGDNSDYVVLTVEPKGEPARRMRLSIGGADVLLAELGGLLYGEPAPGPAGQDEPVAWTYEWTYGLVNPGWEPRVSLDQPKPRDWIRNIRPLYAAPAPSRPADREDIALRIAAQRLCDRWELMSPDGEEAIGLIGALWNALALRDAPRDGGGGTQGRQEDHR